jgi:hypothetical protein
MGGGGGGMGMKKKLGHVNYENVVVIRECWQLKKHAKKLTISQKTGNLKLPWASTPISSVCTTYTVIRGKRIRGQT